MTSFRYAPEILAHYPNVVGGVILARDMSNCPTPEGLQAAYQAEQKATVRRIGEAPLSQINSLAAWRGVFRGFGVDPTQYRSAAEALLRRLTKKGDIPSINTLVDIGNLVSIRYALPVAIFDTRAIQQPITVRFADGSEGFTTLGQSEQEHPEPGEAIFADERGLVVSRRWCWRQSEESAAQLDTSAAIITVEAHHERGHHDVRAAMSDLLELLGMYAGGQFTSEVLDEGRAAV